MKFLFGLLAVIGAILTFSYAMRWLRFLMWQLQATLGPLFLLAGIIGLLYFYLRDRSGRNRRVR